MRHFLIAALTLLPLPAIADACHDEIAALFDGGTLDSGARPKHWQIREVFAPDGSLLYTFEFKVASATQTAAGVIGSGNYMMTIGNKTWSGPSIDGPWSPSGDMSGDIAASQAQVVTSMRANLAETECLGLTEFDGESYLTYKYRTKTDPSPVRGDSWWGALDTIYLDPKTGQVMIWIQTEHIASWAPDMKMERHVTRLKYDETIVISPE